MKKSRFTEEQIVFALKQAELETSFPDVSPKLGISDATFHTWHKKYGGISPSELKQIWQLEEENLRLKKLVAALTLQSALCFRFKWSKQRQLYARSRHCR